MSIDAPSPSPEETGEDKNTPESEASHKPLNAWVDPEIAHPETAGSKTGSVVDMPPPYGQPAKTDLASPEMFGQGPQKLREDLDRDLSHITTLKDLAREAAYFVKERGRMTVDKKGELRPAPNSDPDEEAANIAYVNAFNEARNRIEAENFTRKIHSGELQKEIRAKRAASKPVDKLKGVEPESKITHDEKKLSKFEKEAKAEISKKLGELNRGKGLEELEVDKKASDKKSRAEKAKDKIKAKSDKAREKRHERKTKSTAHPEKPHQKKGPKAEKAKPYDWAEEEAKVARRMEAVRTAKDSRPVFSKEFSEPPAADLPTADIVESELSPAQAAIDAEFSRLQETLNENIRHLNHTFSQFGDPEEPSKPYNWQEDGDFEKNLAPDIEPGKKGPEIIRPDEIINPDGTKQPPPPDIVASGPKVFDRDPRSIDNPREKFAELRNTIAILRHQERTSRRGNPEALASAEAAYEEALKGYLATELYKKYESGEITEVELQQQIIESLSTEMLYRSQAELEVQEQNKGSKFLNWFSNHPKLRMGIGIAATGVGLVSAAAGLFPVSAAALSLKAAMSGIGAASTSKSVMDRVAGWKQRRNNKEAASLDDLAISELTGSEISKKLADILAPQIKTGKSVRLTERDAETIGRLTQANNERLRMQVEAAMAQGRPQDALEGVLDEFLTSSLQAESAKISQDRHSNNVRRASAVLIGAAAAGLTVFLGAEHLPKPGAADAAEQLAPPVDTPAIPEAYEVTVGKGGNVWSYSRELLEQRDPEWNSLSADRKIMKINRLKDLMKAGMSANGRGANLIFSGEKLSFPNNFVDDAIGFIA